jgi:hypothetical protein
MRLRVLLPGLCVLVAGGCKQHLLTDYRPLDQAGMSSGEVEQLKTLNVSDAEVPQIVKLKSSGISDDSCVALVSIAHQHQHLFTSADSTASLAGAGYSETQILAIARTDHLDSLSSEAVTLRLIGLSNTTVQFLLDRHLQGVPTLSSGEISRLKNTGLTEPQILERIKEGMTDEQADAEIAKREALRNHANTGFVRVHGRRSR